MIINDEHLPGVEDVYDMDKENLQNLRWEILREFGYVDGDSEDKVNKIIEVLNDDNDLDDFDDDFAQYNSISISRTDKKLLKKGLMKRLYKFVIAELKERDYMDQVLDFFTDKKGYYDIVSSIKEDNYFEIDKNKDEVESSVTKDTSIQESSNIYEKLSLKELKSRLKIKKTHPPTHIHTQPNNTSYYRTNRNSISLLQKTKLDDNFKFLVGQASFIPPVRKVKTSSGINPSINNENKKIGRHKQIQGEIDFPKKGNNFSSNLTTHINSYKKERDISEPVKISYNINLNINISNQNKKRKKKKKIESQPKENKPSNIELRKNYVVPDIRTFIKRKTTLMEQENVNKVEDIVNALEIKSDLEHFNDKNVANSNYENAICGSFERKGIMDDRDKAEVENTKINNSNNNDRPAIKISKRDIIDASSKINSTADTVDKVDKANIDNVDNIIITQINHSVSIKNQIENDNENKKEREIYYASQMHFEEEKPFDPNSIEENEYEQINENNLSDSKSIISEKNEDCEEIEHNIENLVSEKQNSENEGVNFEELKQIAEEQMLVRNSVTKPKSSHNRYRDKSAVKFGLSGQNFHKTTSSFYRAKNPYNSIYNKSSPSIGLLKSRSKSSKIPSKMPLLKHIHANINAENIPDYSKFYKNFYEIFNGYFLSQNNFEIGSAMASLYDGLKNLLAFECIDQEKIEKLKRVNVNIVEAEIGMIKNRLRQVSDKLLADESSIHGDKYYILRKVMDMQNKDYFKKTKKDETDISPSSSLSRMYFRVVLSKPEIYDIMCYTLGLREEWNELPHGMQLGQSWNLLWTYSAPSIDITKVFSFQKVNHLINNRVLSRKDLLKKSLDRVRRINNKLNKIFDIMPTTYILSRDYVDFVDEFTRIKNSLVNPAHNLWIVKPVGKSRGRGIFVINEISEVPLADSILVQKYLTNPLLIEGYKFDMRIYVLVTSVNPLEAFLYKDGFARVSNSPFSLENNNRLVHLTNAAVQNKIAQTSARGKSSDFEKLYGGSKISLEMLKEKLLRRGINFDSSIWGQIKDIVLKSLVACQHEIPYAPSTFELFGYDIIIDTDLKCWLLEVNSSPSLERSNVLDDQIKLKLVDDVINLINPINYDHKALVEVLERRLNINTNVSNGVYLYSPTIQLNMDMNKIFRGKVPRAYGEVPDYIGDFEMIAPGEESERLIKITGGQKICGKKP